MNNKYQKIRVVPNFVLNEFLLDNLELIPIVYFC